jgi:hypothetical protein
MDEPPLVLFEFDSPTSMGVRLVVSRKLLPEGIAATCFEINVDGKILATHVGPRDLQELIAFLQRNKA